MKEFIPPTPSSITNQVHTTTMNTKNSLLLLLLHPIRGREKVKQTKQWRWNTWTGSLIVRTWRVRARKVEVMGVEKVMGVMMLETGELRWGFCWGEYRLFSCSFGGEGRTTGEVYKHEAWMRERDMYRGDTHNLVGWLVYMSMFRSSAMKGWGLTMGK